MHSVSPTYTAILAGAHHYEFKATIGGVDYYMNQIVELSTSASLFATTPTVGNATSRSITLKLLLGSNQVIAKGAKIQIFVRIANQTQVSEWLPKGVFYIDSRDYDLENNVLTLTGYDCIMRLKSKKFVSDEWPEPHPDGPHDNPHPIGYYWTVQETSETLAGLMGTTMADNQVYQEYWVYRNTSYNVAAINKYPYNEALEYLVASQGANAITTDDGKLAFIPLQSTASVATLTQSDYETGGLYGDGSIKFGGAIVQVGGQETSEISSAVSGRTNVSVRVPWGDSDVATRIKSVINGFVYQPYQATNAVLDMAVELGDFITFDDTLVQITSQNINFDLLCASDITAPMDSGGSEFPYLADDGAKWAKSVSEQLKDLAIKVYAIDGTSV